VEPYFFFLSYAREDGDELLVSFKRSLEAAVLARTIHAPDRICFRDRDELEVGDAWLPDLSEAIRSCKVFVPVLTRRYFTKDFCGREWAAFHRRLQLAGAQGQAPRLIVPVLWIGKDAILPGVPQTVGALQFDNAGLPDEYTLEGARFLLRISKYESEAQLVVERLASRIVDVAARAVAELPAHIDLSTIDSAFKPTAGVAPPPAAATGPRYVQFIFVAASADEIRRVRTQTESYGSASLDWKPFLPDTSDEIAVIAQQVAADQKFISALQPAGADLVERISSAEKSGSLVAMIVDTWTLQVGGTYERVLREYDGRRFANCAVMVPWNPKDQENTAHQARLERKLLSTLARTKSGNDPRFFLEQIDTPDRFRGDLARTLSALRAQVATFADVQKRAESQEGGVVARPII